MCQQCHLGFFLRFLAQRLLFGDSPCGATVPTVPYQLTVAEQSVTDCTLYTYSYNNSVQGIAEALRDNVGRSITNQLQS